MTFDEWYNTIVKYVHPNDLYQWMHESWEAALKYGQNENKGVKS